MSPPFVDPGCFHAMPLVAGFLHGPRLVCALHQGAALAAHYTLTVLILDLPKAHHSVLESEFVEGLR
jgi:hypothetical protein